MKPFILLLKIQLLGLFGNNKTQHADPAKAKRTLALAALVVAAVVLAVVGGGSVAGADEACVSDAREEPGAVSSLSPLRTANNATIPHTHRAAPMIPTTIFLTRGFRSSRPNTDLPMTDPHFLPIL